MGICVLTYFVTLPAQAGSTKEVVESLGDLEKFLDKNEALINFLKQPTSEKSDYAKTIEQLGKLV